jgi:hypothetical protein
MRHELVDETEIHDNKTNERIGISDFVDQINDMIEFMKSIGADYDYEKDWKGKQNEDKS